MSLLDVPAREARAQSALELVDLGRGDLPELGVSASPIRAARCRSGAWGGGAASGRSRRCGRAGAGPAMRTVWLAILALVVPAMWS